MYSAANDGLVTDWHVLHYTTRAVGQVGLIIVEATAVEPRGRISDHDLALWEDRQIVGFQRLVDSVHAQPGAKIAIQLAHAGRKSEVLATTPVSPSAIAYSDDYREPIALTESEIQEIVQKFIDAAKRAVQAGFDAIELHAAHGYLINEFLSPLTNLRTDRYGGSLANRARFLDEILSGVRSVIPAEMPVIVRLSASDYHADGNTPESVAALLNLVKQHGIDLVNVSSGAVIPVMPRAFAGYQIPMALTIKEQTGLPVLGGGLITQPVQALQVVKAGVDLVFLGRELLRNPYWALQAADRLHKEVNWPEQYLRGKWS
jgi:NADPH2 dehydrogenase